MSTSWKSGTPPVRWRPGRRGAASSKCGPSQRSSSRLGVSGWALLVGGAYRRHSRRRTWREGRSLIDRPAVPGNCWPRVVCWLHGKVHHVAAVKCTVRLPNRRRTAIKRVLHGQSLRRRLELLVLGDCREQSGWLGFSYRFEPLNGGILHLCSCQRQV